jgi:hypothetical protein
MKQRVKIVEIPSGANLSQIENGINNALGNGWKILQIITLGTKVYVIFIKTLSL